MLLFWDTYRKWEAIQKLTAQELVDGGMFLAELNHAIIHITREMILGFGEVGSDEQNLDLVVLTRDERLVISADGMADYV